TNIRRIGFVGGMLSRNGVISLTAAISPYRATRESIREQTVNFIEVFVDCPVEVCAQRDVKGLYEKAYRGEIANFTGVSDPYEPPVNPEIVLKTHEESIEESVKKVMTYLVEHDYISRMP
ncbi:MAG: adenylyl-sulfate kinase, partial [Synechococcus sp.]